MHDWRWMVWQEGLCVASGSCPTEEEAMKEGLHYATQYAQDGQCALELSPPKRKRPLPVKEGAKFQREE